MAMGVYKIINAVNHAFYIGSAVNLGRRKSRHFSELRANKHNNAFLQAAWNKYGPQAFAFVVVEEVLDSAVLLEAEDRWLKLHVGKPYCYNIGVSATAPMLGMSGEKSPTWGRKRTATELAAQNWLGRRHTPESREAIRRSRLGHEVPTETRLKISAALSGEGNYWYGKKRPDHGAKVSRPVMAIEPNGGTTEYPSISALREALGVKPPTVNRALKSGKPIARGRLQGWVIRYVDTPTPT